MFKFDFEIEDGSLREEGISFSASKGSSDSGPPTAFKESFTELILTDLVRPASSDEFDIFPALTIWM